MSDFSFGKSHATCCGCGTLCKNEELEDGQCLSCEQAQEQRRLMIMEKAEQGTVAKFVRQLTADIKANKKNEPIAPAILESALGKLGAHYGKDGKEALGDLLGEQLLKSTGQCLTPKEAATWKHSPLVIHRWVELMSRLAVRIDDRHQVDVSTLSEADLLSSLTTLLHEVISTNGEFRRMAMLEIIRTDPSLIHEAMTAAGMPAVDGHVVAPPIDLGDDEFNAEAVEDDDEDVD